MKKILFFIFPFLFNALIYAQSLKENLFLDLIMQEKYDSAFLFFDTKLISKEDFINALTKLDKQNGKIVRYKYSGAVSPTHLVYKAYTDKQQICLVSIFYKDTLKNTVEGFWSDVRDFKKPKYAKNSLFAEQDFNIVSNGYKLFGTITTPSAKNDTMLAILIHGSGNCDRDETIGGIKVFRDIAWGLSSKNIPTVRYDKRTFTYNTVETLNGYSINEEVIDDAVNMINYFANDSLGRKKVIIIGHSLGAMCAPLIASKIKNKVAGIVLLASPARSLDEVLADQLNYQLSNLKLDSADIKDLNNEIALTKNVTILRNNPTQSDMLKMPLGYPVSYFKSLIAYNNIEYLENTELPVLVLWGNRDYQVNLADFQILKNKFGNKSNFTFKEYKDLNHMFVSGKGKSLPDEYEKKNNVDVNVIRDIEQWIKALK